jgi:hypothetical protein
MDISEASGHPLWESDDSETMWASDSSSKFDAYEEGSSSEETLVSDHVGVADVYEMSTMLSPYSSSSYASSSADGSGDESSSEVDQTDWTLDVQDLYDTSPWSDIKVGELETDLTLPVARARTPPPPKQLPAFVSRAQALPAPPPGLAARSKPVPSARAKPTPAKDSPPRVRAHAKDQDSLVCPFCESQANAALEGKGHNRQRKYPRKTNKKQYWYKRFGYAGPAYCKRCSEIINNHLLRQTAKNYNRAGCSRAKPCSHCTQVLSYVSEHTTFFNAIDAERSARQAKRAAKEAGRAAAMSESANSHNEGIEDSTAPAPVPLPPVPLPPVPPPGQQQDHTGHKRPASWLQPVRPCQVHV